MMPTMDMDLVVDGGTGGSFGLSSGLLSTFTSQSAATAITLH